MSFKILADTFSVARDSDHFVQLKTLKNPHTEDQVWVSFAVEGDTKFARATLQNITDSLESVFFDNFDMGAYERFEAALKEINLIHKNLTQKKGQKSIGQISAIIGIFSGSSLFLTQSKDAEAYLIRKGKLSLISEGLAGKSDDLFVNIASGELASEDKVVFTTSRLLRLVSHNALANLCKDGVTESIDSIRELVMTNSELSIGVTCMHLKMPHHIVSTAPTKESKRALILKEWWNKVADLVDSKMGNRRMQVNKNNILAALLGIILLLILSVSFLMENNRSRALRDEYKEQIDAMNQDLRTANTKGYANDKATANAILDKVEGQARAIMESNYFRSEALSLLDKVQQTRDNINNTIRLNTTAPYVDLAAKNASVEALGLVNLVDKFFVYEYNRLYEVILDQVLDPKTIDATEVVLTATAMEDQGVIVFLAKSGRIMEYEGDQFHFANTDDDNWKPAVDLGAYGKNLYLLSPSQNQIFKYSRLRSNYSGASEYSTDANLENAISFAIDGDVYVLNKGGEIIKLFKGKQQTFIIEDMATDLSEATKIFTSVELNHLYILDPVGKRVVILEKLVNGSARYKGQVYFNDLTDIQSFYVEKKGDTMYLLTKTGIYQVDIQQE